MRVLGLLVVAGLAWTAGAVAARAQGEAPPEGSDQPAPPKKKKAPPPRVSAMQGATPVGHIEYLKKKAAGQVVEPAPPAPDPPPPADRLKAIPEPENTGYPAVTTLQPPADLEGPSMVGARAVAPPPKKPKKAPVPSKKPKDSGH